MASDLKLEIFAYNIFQTVFQSHRLIQYKPKVFEIYGNGCLGDRSYAEVYDDLFHKAIFCRRELFQIVYKGEIMYEKIESCRSPLDLFDYLIIRCDQDYLFHNLSVFERMFATCAFVVSMCVHIYWYNVVDVISYGHLFWAIFFDKYTEEFYKEGGWNQLKRVAKTYDFLYEFLALFPENFDSYFRAIKEASANYCRFMEDAFSKEYKRVSKMWVRFHIENFENYVKIPVSYEVSLNPIKIELLLEELKQFCDPRPKEAYEYDQFRDSEAEMNCFNRFALTTDNSESDDISLERYRVKRVNEFVSRTSNSLNSSEDSESDDISLERYRVKRMNEFVSRTDNYWNSSEDSDSDNISQRRSEVKSDNDFVLYNDVSASSLDDSDNDDMFQETHQRDFSVGKTSDVLEICTEIKTKDNDLSIQPFVLSNKNRIVDTFSDKVSKISIEYSKFQRENSILNSFKDVLPHLQKNKFLEHKEKSSSRNTNEFGLNTNLVTKHNVFAGETTSQSFELINGNSQNTKGLGYLIANYNRNANSENEGGTANNLNSRNATFQREVANEGARLLKNQVVKCVWEAKPSLKSLRTPKELNLVNEHKNIVNERKNTTKIGNVYYDSRNGEINEYVKPMDILLSNLQTISELNAETSLDIVHNLEDFDVVNGYESSNDGEESIKTTSECLNSRKRETNQIVNSMVATESHEKSFPNTSRNSVSNNLNTKVKSEDEINIIKKNLDASKNKLDNSSLNQRTFFKLEQMKAVGCIRRTSFTEEEMLEYSSESFKNSKKRTRKEHEASRKKFSPERKEIENEMFP